MGNKQQGAPKSSTASPSGNNKSQIKSVKSSRSEPGKALISLNIEPRIIQIKEF